MIDVKLLGVNGGFSGGLIFCVVFRKNGKFFCFCEWLVSWKWIDVEWIYRVFDYVKVCGVIIVLVFL